MSKVGTDPVYPRSLDELVGSHKAAAVRPVAIFDFDGVLSHPEEDRVYHLGGAASEVGRLRKAASHYEIDAAVFDARYLRHLVFQAIQNDRGVLPRPGPLLDLSKDIAERTATQFILTARSGPQAIKRVLSFIDHHRLNPQEVFFVGRVPKGRQLALVQKTAEDAPIWYFEDSPKHVRNSRRQELEGLTTVPVVRGGSDEEARLLLQEALAWFEGGRDARKAA